MMKSVTKYFTRLRELIRERVRTLSEYDRTERQYDESLRRYYPKRDGRAPTITKGRGPTPPEREWSGGVPVHAPSIFSTMMVWLLTDATPEPQTSTQPSPNRHTKYTQQH